MIYKSKTKEPKLKGKLYALIIEMKLETFILLIISGYFILAIFFAIIYTKYEFTSSKQILDNLYFSLITQTTIGYGDILPVSIYGRFTASIQAIIGMFYTSIFIAILLYKLIKISPNVIKFEEFAVFSPKDGTLRIRAINLFKLPLTDVKVNMYFRIWLESENRFATYDICLKRNKIPFMEPKVSWNFATQPINPDKNYKDLEDLDTTRQIIFHPKYVNKRYFPETFDTAKMLRIQVKAEIPLFGTSIITNKSYKYNEIRCGKYFNISLESSNYHWENWGKIREPSLKDFKNCNFKKECGIFRNYKINDAQPKEKDILYPWIRFRQ